MLAPCPLGHDFDPPGGFGGDSPWIPSRASAPAGFLGHVGCTCRASLRRLKDLAAKMDPGNDAIISIDECDPKPKWSNLFKRRDEPGVRCMSQTASSFSASPGAAGIKFALFE